MKRFEIVLRRENKRMDREDEFNWGILSMHIWKYTLRPYGSNNMY
jgi:hypothetical protein